MAYNIFNYVKCETEHRNVFPFLVQPTTFSHFITNEKRPHAYFLRGRNKMYSLLHSQVINYIEHFMSNNCGNCGTQI